MAEYINRTAFLEQYRSLYCSDCDGRKNAKWKIVYEIGDAPCRACDIGDMLDAVEDFPAANLQQTCNHVATNADRIRAMTDEELAEFIGEIYTLERDVWGDYDPCVVVDQGVKIRDKDDMLDWLQSPADGGAE